MVEPKRKRGRPRKPKEKPVSWPEFEGVSYVARRRDDPQALSHRWVSVIGTQVIGYYKTPVEAHEARVKEVEKINEDKSAD